MRKDVAPEWNSSWTLRRLFLGSLVTKQTRVRSICSELADAGSTLHVPEQWPLEVLNGLTRAARRGRIENRDVNRFLHALLDYRIVVSQSAVPLQWSEAMSLIASHRLSAYDAAYLALAKRLQVGLATFDQQLRMAALAEHVTLIV